MSDYTEGFAKLARSAIVAAVLFAFSWLFLSDPGGSMFGAFGAALIGFGIMLMGVVVLAIPIARLVAEPSGSLFYPRIHSKPHPPYSIPECKAAKGQYEEAMTLFERIAAEYPDALKAYVGMVDIAIMHLKDPARAESIYRRGLTDLRTADSREALTRMYDAIRSRLQSEPEWLTVEKRRTIGVPGRAESERLSVNGATGQDEQDV
jgi:hypothetical protein